MTDCPEAGLIGVEPDQGALALARRKFGAGADLVKWHNGFLENPRAARRVAAEQDRQQPRPSPGSLAQEAGNPGNHRKLARARRNRLDRRLYEAG
ncbi:hypothetical protein ACIGGE_05595 [Qipengyuania sp. NPDC077410]|uniref:hypothetical protein n=1 Tax=Qipengyuania sp. NPDC077410 TaxID=3364496 RepID=UPI0037C6F4FA